MRRATPDDLDAVMALETAIYPDDAWSSATMAAELANPYGHYLVETGEDDAIVAYAGLLAPLGTGQGDIQTVTVAPEARRQGLARRLLSTLIDEARRRGAEELFLEVRVDNEAAQALYRELGFEELSVRKSYYGQGIDALTMKLKVV
ncbi:MAG TPA: ribosomal protein S18-alanine N-acetyltransferase [Pseudolysinimonas sp.]|jgi:ribosomal-protein-alanine acetyltransferase|nr:ribosomal protein S18-alanine N-acetyltransferase [Pseudolysinimonas sp.]